MALSKGPSKKFWRLSVTMQIVFRNLRKIGYPMLLLIWTILPILLRTKHLTTSCLAMAKDCVMMSFCRLLAPLFLWRLLSDAAIQFQTIHASLRDKLKASLEEMLPKQQLQGSPITFSVWDSVIKHVPDRSCKLLPKFLDSYLITEKMHGNKFNILDPISHISEVIHADRLKHVSVPLSRNIQPPIPSSTSGPSILSPLDTSSSSCKQKLRSVSRLS